MEMKLMNILEHKHLVMWIFFVCIHTLRLVYIVYASFSRHRHFFDFREYILSFGSPTSVNPHRGGTRVDILTFLFLPFSLHFCLIPQLLTSRLAPSASIFWIWCHFNIGLILFVQIKMLWTVNTTLGFLCTATRSPGSSHFKPTHFYHIPAAELRWLMVCRQHGQH